MGPMKINVDYDLCEANAVCVAFAPEVFEVDDDDNLFIIGEVTPENLAQVRQAVAGCPKTALSLDESAQGDTAS